MNTRFDGLPAHAGRPIASVTEPFTDAQFESVAHVVAAASRALGLPVNHRGVQTAAATKRPLQHAGPATAEGDDTVAIGGVGDADVHCDSRS
jgi:hypothetical protein